MKGIIEEITWTAVLWIVLVVILFIALIHFVIISLPWGPGSIEYSVEFHLPKKTCSAGSKETLQFAVPVLACRSLPESAYWPVLPCSLSRRVPSDRQSLAIDMEIK